jgi:DnaJ-domain-containing protein 1
VLSETKTSMSAKTLCRGCETLKKNLAQARMHSLLALVWSEMHGLPQTSELLEVAVLQLKRAHLDLENHRLESHRILGESSSCARPN